MNEFIEKLIGRLEEYKYSHLVEHDKERLEHCTENERAEHCEGIDCFWCVWNKSIEIVNQLAEEYNNGWIPCSERLPEENGYYLITIKYYHLHNNVTMGCFFDDGEWWKIDKDDKVIAWQPLPEPYRQKGGTE